MEPPEKYPDVTLGEHGALNSVRGVDTVVALRGAPGRGCFLSRARALLLAFLVLLVVAAVVLLVLFLGGLPGFGCQCGHVTPTRQSQTPAGSSRPPGLPPTSPPGGDGQPPRPPPWAGIRLPRHARPRHYDLLLRVDLSLFEFSGAVNVSLQAVRPSRFLVLHRADLNLSQDAVRVRELLGPEAEGEERGRGAPASRDVGIVRQWEEAEQQFHVVELERELQAGRGYVLEMGDFRGEIRTDLRGLYRSSYRDRQGNIRYLASSQLQSTDARRVFPCFDEPDFKATFKVTIIHQDGYEALNNMPVERSWRQEPGWQRREFQRTPIMSTYILAFVVSDFKFREAEIDNGYKLRVWSQPDSYKQTAHALEFGVKTYRFFTDYFNITDVVPKADHVAVPDFSAGAMENWGLVIYRETALLYDPDVSSSSNKYTVTLIVAHEIAHTWFGNMVTMKWWDDLWLNEGFASILMYLAMEHAYPEWNVFALQVVEEMFPVMLKDALVTSHPVSAEIRHPDDIQQVFSVISYNKGMAVLRMLQGFIGPEKFRNGLRIYVDRFKFGNAELDELWQTFTEAVEGKVAIKQVMDTWTLQKGYPVVTVRDEGASLRLEQQRFLFDPDSVDPDSENNTFRYEWFIPFTHTSQQDPASTHTTWLNRGSEWILKPRGWLLGNVDYMGFYRVNYETDMWRQLIQQLARNHSVFLQANRAGLIGDSLALARANLLDYDVALNLTRYLKDELSYVPWRAFLDAIEFLRGMIAAKPAYVSLQKYLRTLVEPVLEALGVEDGGALPERYLRRVILEVACDVGLEKAVQHAMRLFNDWKVNQTRLPPDQALLVYSVGVREGGQDVWDFIWNKAQHTPVPSEREMMMDALAQTEKPWLLWRYANWLFDSSKIRQQDVRVVVKHFTHNPLGRIIALEFLMSRWDELNDGFGTDLYLLREVIQEVTKFVNSEFHLKQLEGLFRDKTPKSASMAANSALALIRSNIQWMSRHYHQIAAWLEQNVT